MRNEKSVGLLIRALARHDCIFAAITVSKSDVTRSPNSILDNPFTFVSYGSKQMCLTHVTKGVRFVWMRAVAHYMPTNSSVSTK
ncbi:Uncharacterized protein HZ326_8367 [Fusarium oxysporum f. sp. albedinis]|nr:Uncharacterized protein HZ326_8367 [Fusarium oxysporum f. sp. albedinis]